MYRATVRFHGEHGPVVAAWTEEKGATYLDDPNGKETIAWLEGIFERGNEGLLPRSLSVGDTVALTWEYGFDNGSWVGERSWFIQPVGWTSKVKGDRIVSA